MQQSRFTFSFVAFLSLTLLSLNGFSENGSLPSPRSIPRSMASTKPTVTPTAPILNAKAYLLIDVNSGKIIAEKNSQQKLPPASLTKLMTLYVASKALKNGEIKLEDTVHISEKAWKTGGSRMFVKEGEDVTLENLLKGVIVDSGNDACVAVAEHLGGSETGFTDIMNQQAKELGMNDSHFTDSTGLPDKDHYTTAQDLAVVARALILNYPEYYPWYKQKWFTYNGIRQPNRNRLLWRNSNVDGLKTGFTDDAGYCLISSAQKDNMRLLAVVLGAPSESVRADDSERLLNYGFRFFETHELYKAKQPIAELPVYKGYANTVAVGLNHDEFITIPNGQYQRLSVTTEVPKHIVAPIEQHQTIGELVIKFDNQVVSTFPLVALTPVERGGVFTRAKDAVKLAFSSLWG